MFSSFKRTCLFLFTTLIPFSLIGQQRWYFVNPFPHGNLVKDIIPIGKKSLITVGNAGTIFKSKDRGQTWKQVFLPFDVDLYAVSFADSTRGFAVGTDGIIIKTTNCGDSWEKLESGRKDTLRTVLALSSTLILAAGDSGTYLRSVDGGDSWTYEPIPGFSPNFHSLYFGLNGRGYLVGDSMGTWGPPVLISEDSGATFSPFGGGGASLASKSIFSVWTPKADPNKAVLVGDEGLILNTSTAGISWNAPVSGTTVPIRDVWFFDDQNGFAVGPGGTVLRTTNCGDTWSVVPINMGGELVTVRSRDSLEGYLAGESGFLARTLDGGDTWQTLSSGFYPRLNDITFLDDSFGIAAGQFGAALRTSDAGLTWQQSFIGNLRPIEALSKAGDSPLSPKFWAAGGTFGDSARMFVSSDKGINWRRQPLFSPFKLFAVNFTDSLHGFSCGLNGTIFRTGDGGDSWLPTPSGSTDWLLDISLPSIQVGFVVGGNGTILKTEDAGVSWTPQSSGTQEWLTSVSFIDDSFGIAAGNHGVVLRTKDGGTNWENISPEGVDRDFTGISIGDGSRFSNRTHTTDYTLTLVGYNGLIYYSADNGDTWTRQLSQTRQDLFGVHFTGSESGFVCGELGAILQMDSLIQEDPVGISLFEEPKALLGPLYPNPASQYVRIPFSLKHSGSVQISVFSQEGKLIERVVEGIYSAGDHVAELSLKPKLSQGFYLVRLVQNGQTDVRRLIVAD